MNNYTAILEYDGTDFKGFQSQPKNLRTVQGELFRALKALVPDFFSFSYAGRTDAGVHAKHQVIGFKTEKELDTYRIKWKLNCILPEDISIKELKKVTEPFNARKDATLREYSYCVVNNSYQSVFLKKYSIMITKKLDVDIMRRAADRFIGIKDFKAFCSYNSGTDFTVRHIYSFKIKRFSQGLIVFKIAANSFLYNMVRIIVGTLLEAGNGKRDIESIEEALKSKNRKLAGKMVSPKGLCLTKVEYQKY